MGSLVAQRGSDSFSSPLFTPWNSRGFYFTSEKSHSMVQLFTSEIKVIEKEPCGEKLRKTKKGRLQKYAQTT